jgi:transcriptional regulator with XRE-family HTH domain
MYEIIKSLCEERGTTITSLCKEITGSSGNLSTWKKGYIKRDYLEQIADKFDVPVDYLKGETEVKSKRGFSHIMKVMQAHPQRIASLRSEDIPSIEEYKSLSEYLRCSQTYLFRLQEYVQQEVTTDGNADANAKDMIYEILDCCAGNNDYKILQKQISRIVKHNLEERLGAEQTKGLLSSIGLDSSKVNALYDIDDSTAFGFNFSDFMRIKRKSNLTSDYLLTGRAS